MAIARAGTVAVGNSVSATTFDAPLPASIAAGEVVILWVIGKQMTGVVPAAPSGWLERGRISAAAMDILLLYRVGTGSEGATITIDNGVNATTWATIAQRYTGVDTTTPFCAANVSSNGTSTAATPTTDTSVTTTENDAMLIACIGIDDPGNANRTPTVGGTAGLTEVGQNLTNMVAEADDGLQATAGASGTVNWTWTNVDIYSHFMTALKPAAVGGGATGHTRMALTGVG